MDAPAFPRGRIARRLARYLRRGKTVLIQGLLVAFILVCIALTVSSWMRDLGRGLPPAVGGVLDLREWDFAASGPVELRTDWLFHGGALLSSAEAAATEAWTVRSVPDLWKGTVAGDRGGRGAGTYRLTVLLPPALDRPALRYMTASTAMEIEANGEPIARSGRPSLRSADARSAYGPDVVPLPRSARQDFVVRVSNYVYRGGGLWQPFMIGPLDRLRRDKRLADAAAIALFAFNAAIAFHSFVQFFLKQAARTNLILGLFTSLVSLRALVTGEYLLAAFFPGLPFSLIVRLEYLTAFLPLPLGLRYLQVFYSVRFARPHAAILYLPSILLAALTPFLPLVYLTRTVPYYYPVVIFSILSAIVVFIRGARVARPVGSVAVACGAVLVTAAALNDMFFAPFSTNNSGTLLPWSLALFVVIQETILASHFAEEFVKATALAEERERHAKDMHHRVKNSLQLVSSILTLQSNRATDVSLIEALKITRDRIRSVSLAHERLYISEREGTADLGDYLRDLAEQLEFSYSGDPRDSAEAAKIAIAAPTVETPVDFCVDVGLIVTELVVNAYMHAAKADGRVALDVTATLEGDRLRLVVADDGPGFPPDFKPEKSEGLGFRVVCSIARQRRGSVALEPGKGSRVVVLLSIAESNR